MGYIPHFAVLQKAATAPTVPQLKRVFHTFSHLTDADAVRLSVDARGILMRRLTRDSARALQQAFLAEGLAVAIVSERDLPELPEAHSLHRLEIWPQTFAVYDLRGRRTTIAWPDISLVAAGAAQHYDAEKVRDSFSAGSSTRPKRAREARHPSALVPQLWLEILLRGSAARYQLEAAKFTFRYVIDRPGLSLEERFIWLVREICRHSTRAVLNHGAQLLRDGEETVLPYSSRHTLTDEIVWILWREARSGSRS